MEFFARDQFSRTLQQHDQDLKRLIGEFDFRSVAPQFAAAKVRLELFKCHDLGRR